MSDFRIETLHGTRRRFSQKRLSRAAVRPVTSWPDILCHVMWYGPLTMWCSVRPVKPLASLSLALTLQIARFLAAVTHTRPLFLTFTPALHPKSAAPSDGVPDSTFEHSITRPLILRSRHSIVGQSCQKKSPKEWKRKKEKEWKSNPDNTVTHTDDYDFYLFVIFVWISMGAFSDFWSPLHFYQPMEVFYQKWLVLLLGDLLGTRTSARSNTKQKMIGQNTEETDGTEIIENLLEGRWRRGANKVSLPNYSKLVKEVCNTFNCFRYVSLKILIIVITFLAPNLDAYAQIQIRFIAIYNNTIV